MVNSVCSPRIERGTCIRCKGIFAYVYTAGSLRKYCDECRPIVREEQQEKLRQSPKAKAAKARYLAIWQKTPEGKAAFARSSVRYRQTPEGKATRAKIMREYYHTPEGRAAIVKREAAYRQTPEGKAAYAKAGANRRERSTDPESYAARVELLHAMREPCAECGVPYKVSHQVDHIIALCLGGTDDWDNLEPKCTECHRRKSGKDLSKFRELLKERFVSA